MHGSVIDETLYANAESGRFGRHLTGSIFHVDFHLTGSIFHVDFHLTGSIFHVDFFENKIEGFDENATENR